MFLDLKDSTHHAELLGHQRFSTFINDCFSDMTSVIKDTGAEVYQYVGDEIILTWKANHLMSYENSMRLFFLLKLIVFSTSESYLNKYGIIPEFKAGIHCGTVMRTQIGTVKKEIAFHGDVLNTTARIQSKCNDLNSDLLVSESFKDHLPGGYDFHWEGGYLLKGKESKVNLYSCKNQTQNICYPEAQRQGKRLVVFG